jgi:DNA polymerase-3 subunit gamma/tau
MAPAVWDESKLELLLDVEQEAIYSTSREKELIQALSIITGNQLKISIRIDKPVAETPAMQKQRMSDERQQAAVDSISTDASVTQIVDAFGATIAPSSIKPLNTQKQE